MKKILLTGGHVTPAIATIEEIQARFAKWDVVFVGRKFALEKSSVVSEEYRLITEMGVRFLPISAGRWKLATLYKIPFGLVHAFILLKKERPNLVVSFGGYVGFPVAVAAWTLGIPIIIHEQTTRPGVANRLIGRLAKKICLTFPDTQVYFSRERSIVTGLPIRRVIRTSPTQPPFALPNKKPILLVVGGSTGSVSINTIVLNALPKLLQRFVVVHQLGRESRQLEFGSGYKTFAYISADNYSWLLRHAKIVISRSGANTVMELAMHAVVSICIPLPWASQNEQYYNAKFLEQGGSMILEQKNASAENLVASVDETLSTWSKRKDKAEKLSNKIPKDGATRFVDVIASYV